MDLSVGVMRGPEPLQQTLHLVGQLLQQPQQQQVTCQIALDEKWMQQQAWVQRNQVELKAPRWYHRTTQKPFWKVLSGQLWLWSWTGAAEQDS